MNELALRKDLDRGAKAERILNDPLVKEAFEKAENHFLNMFKTADLRDDEGIMRAKDLLHAVTLVRRFFEDTVRHGEAAKDLLNPEKRGAPFLGDLWKRR